MKKKVLIKRFFIALVIGTFLISLVMSIFPSPKEENLISEKTELKMH